MRGLAKVAAHLQIKRHWRQIREELWINRVWDEAHEELTNFGNRQILLQNLELGKRTLEIDLKYIASITKIGLDTYAEALNEKVRPS